LIKPRRKDRLLVDGAIYLTPDADLVRVEGRLVKSPSFWTRRVDIVRTFAHMTGVRLPVTVESTAHVTFVGECRFAMTYGYETVNGRRVNTTAAAREIADGRRPPAPASD
jgi:hypothetical protein